MTKVKFSLEVAGYCEASKSYALSGERHESIKFFATFTHIEHPTHGHILFDTGYTRRFYDVTRNLPFKLYAKLTKVFIEEDGEAKNILAKKGISPSEINYIIISHFHADHIGGLRDFPNAQFVCSQVAYENIKNERGITALTKGFIPDLLPDDFCERLQLISFEEPTWTDDVLGGIVDFFGDESVQLCNLEGHAKGQIGALLEADQPIFLVADAAWLQDNYKNLHLPNPVVRLFFDSWKNFKASLLKIHTYHQHHPETLIIPCHCERTYFDIVNTL